MNLKSLTQRRSPIPGLIIAGVAIALWMAVAYSGPDAAPAPTAKAVAATPAPQPAPAKPAVNADLATIYTAYVDNAVAAAARYQDAPITTSGIVRKIEGTAEHPLVYLGDPLHGNVQAAAWLAGGQQQYVLEMKRGEILPLHCLGDIPIDNKIVLRDCRIIHG